MDTVGLVITIGLFVVIAVEAIVFWRLRVAIKKKRVERDAENTDAR